MSALANHVERHPVSRSMYHTNSHQTMYLGCVGTRDCILWKSSVLVKPGGWVTWVQGERKDGAHPIIGIYNITCTICGCFMMAEWDLYTTAGKYQWTIADIMMAYQLICPFATCFVPTLVCTYIEWVGTTWNNHHIKVTLLQGQLSRDQQQIAFRETKSPEFQREQLLDLKLWKVSG